MTILHRSKNEQALPLVKQVYKKLITEVSPLFYKYSIVAGGYLRDWDHDRPIKDMDIFIPQQGMLDDEKADLINAVGDHKDIQYVGGEDGDYDDEDIAVYNMKGFALPVQIIFDIEANTKMEVVSKFHNSLSKIFFNPVTNDVVKFNEYRIATKSKINVYRVSEEDRLTSNFTSLEKHRNRMIKKYPDYKHGIYTKP